MVSTIQIINNLNHRIMTLAEALSLRKDLQARIEQLKQRLLNNIKVQEGEEPTEDPKELMGEMNGCLDQLETLIFRINATNMHVKNSKGVRLPPLALPVMMVQSLVREAHSINVQVAVAPSISIPRSVP